MQDYSAPGEGSSFPRAPSQEEWDALSETQRAAVVEALPAMMTEAELVPSEGDPHSEIKEGVKSTLKEHFRRAGRSVYVATDLTVYYPAAPRFAPDVLVVVDVETHPRMKWVVSNEKRGLDVVLEVHVAGDRKKDLERNVERYAKLGIPEYFVFDRGRRRLHAFRLASGGRRVYVPIVPQEGRFRCETLGLDLVVEGDRVRFFLGSALLLEMPEIVERLQQMTDEVTRRAEREAQRAEQEAQRAEQEAQRADELAARVAALEEELRRRGGG